MQLPMSVVPHFVTTPQELRATKRRRAVRCKSLRKITRKWTAILSESTTRSNVSAPKREDKTTLGSLESTLACHLDCSWLAQKGRQDRMEVAFSLDWSWLDRGERVLKDERFAGLKLPEDFVRPSERIMSSRGVTPRRARSDRETSATPCSARGSDLVSSVTPRSSRKSTPRTPRSGLQDQDVGRAVNFTIVGKNVEGPMGTT